MNMHNAHTFALVEAKGRIDVLDIVEGAASDDRLVEVVGHDGHELGNVAVQHVVDLQPGSCLEKAIRGRV